MRIFIEVDVDDFEQEPGTGLTVTEVVSCWVHDQIGSEHEITDPNSGDTVGRVTLSHENYRVRVEE